MNKITFGGLGIELTRRCNMGCKHCLRGEAQDKDIDLTYLDALLDQADMIDSIIYTGGEPLLCLDAMEYVAKGLRQRGVLLFGLHIVSNGSIYDKKFIEIIKQYREIIDISCRYGFAPETYDPTNEIERVCIGISLDRYHENHDECEANYQRYKQELDGIADVLKIMHGNAPIRLGRAKALSESVDQSHVYPIIERQRVEVLDKDHTPICKVYETFKLIDPNQKIVCCQLFLGADGSLRHGVCNSLSYEMIDSFPVICKVTAPIWYAILLYNKDRISCVESQHEQQTVGLSNEYSKSEGLRLHELRLAPETQDEMSSANNKNLRRWHIEAMNAGNIGGQQILDYIYLKGVKDIIDLLRK